MNSALERAERRREEQLRERQLLLHEHLDELMAAYLAAVPGSRPSTTTLQQLMQWSHAELRRLGVPVLIRTH